MARGEVGNKGIGYKTYGHVSRTSEHTYVNPKEAKGNAVWTIQCILALIGFLKSHVPGDGSKYKPKVLKDASILLNNRIITGGLKKDKGVGDKIRDVCLYFF